MMKNGLLIAVVVLCGLRGPNMPYASIVSIYRSLLLALGILACVLGAWGSIVCPAALKRARDEEKYKGAAAEAANVLTPLFLALVLFMVTLCIACIAPFLQGLDLPGFLRVILKAIASGFAAGIFFLLCLALFALMELVDTFQHVVNQAETKTGMRARFMMGHRVRNDKKTETPIPSKRDR